MIDFTPKDTSSELEMVGDGTTLPGIAFSEYDQAILLGAFQDRYTGDNKPVWAGAKESLYPVQFANDMEWLTHTRFAISPLTRRLDRRIKRCWETPTWPGDPMAYGQLIRDLPNFVQMRFAPNLRTKGWVNQFNSWIRIYLAKERAAGKITEMQSHKAMKGAGFELHDDGEYYPIKGC